MAHIMTVLGPIPPENLGSTSMHGHAIAEMSPTGLRNNVSGLQRISSQTGIHIITPTGLYAEYTWPERFRHLSIEDYTSFMLKEFEQGIDGTGIKPGHIKFAVEDNDVTPQEEQMPRCFSRGPALAAVFGLPDGLEWCGRTNRNVTDR